MLFSELVSWMYVMKELLHLVLDFYGSICSCLRRLLPSFDLEDFMLFSSFYCDVQ